MSESCVEFCEVSKIYGDQTIICGIDLKIDANKTTALVGESGSGKSTLLQLVNGLVRPEAGIVKVFGGDLNYDDLIELRRAMGYAVQGGGLFPHLDVFNNVTMVARLSGWSRDKLNQRYHDLLDMLELSTDLSKRYPYGLSGGQQQRVSLCRAMMMNPRLLLLDEPFSALDPVTRETIYQEYIKIQKIETRSTVLVTHDMKEAARLADYIVVLRSGEIEQQGSAEVVCANPANDYVARMFAEAE